MPEKEIAEPFDSVSVCFSKGLGAPVGSALVGARTFVERARRYKKMFGGGMRQAGVVAAGALHALEHHRARVADDHREARRFAEAVANMQGARIDLERVQSNIVRFEVTETSANAFVEACYAKGLHMLPGGHRGVRAVMHLDVGPADVDAALEIIAGVLAAARA
jgi:threonine aldolase